MANGKFGAKEVMDVTLYNMVTGRPEICFDTLKTSDIEVTSEKVYARGGRGNSKLLVYELNKEAKVTIEDALLSPKSFEIVSGLKSTTGVKALYMRQKNEYDSTGDVSEDKGDDYPLTATSSGAIALAYTPNENAKDILVYLADDDCGTPLDMTEATLEDQTLTIAAAAGKEVIVYYTYNSSDTAETFTIDASHFSGTYKMVGDTVVRNAKTKQDEGFQIVIPNLKWSSDLKLSFAAEGDPQPTSFECEVLKAPGKSTLIQMTKY